MLRERKKKSASSDSKEDSGKSRRSSTNKKSQEIIPTWVLFVVIVFFIFLGFTTEHYKKTRSLSSFHVGSSFQSVHHAKRTLSAKSHLTAEEDEALEYDNGQRYHLIFSTDCSPYQHWQSYLVYFTAMNVRQPGHVTRIVSGCEPEEAQGMINWFNDHIQFMSNRFHLHLTPEFSKVYDEAGNEIGDYKFFNKPFGLKHWLEHFDILAFKDGAFGTSEDDIVVLIDPDMALMRPITGDFSDNRETLIAERRRGEKLLSTKVQRGIPFAQTYGLGVQWQKFDLDAIAGPDSPAKDVQREEGSL